MVKSNGVIRPKIKSVYSCGLGDHDVVPGWLKRCFLEELRKSSRLWVFFNGPITKGEMVDNGINPFFRTLEDKHGK